MQIVTLFFITLFSLNTFADSKVGKVSSVKTIQAENILSTTSSWDGQRLPPYAEGQPEISVVKVVIPPKGDISLHTHPVINAGVILSGELVFQNEEGTKQVHLKQGQAYADVVNKWHKGFNPGRQPTEIIIFHAGVQGLLVTVKE